MVIKDSVLMQTEILDYARIGLFETCIIKYRLTEIKVKNNVDILEDNGFLKETEAWYCVDCEYDEIQVGFYVGDKWL